MSSSKIIRLRFQRDYENSSKDDIIRITYIGERKVSVSYSYYADDAKATRQVMDRTQLTNYLSSMLSLVTADIDPFEVVQFDMPLIPSFCLLPNRLSWEAHNIMKQIDVLFDGWTAAEDDLFAEEESLEASSVEEGDEGEDEDADEGEEESDEEEEESDEDKNKIPTELNDGRIEDNNNINSNNNTNEFDIPPLPSYNTWPHGNHHTFYNAT